jgi:hypothetical protein
MRWACLLCVNVTLSLAAASFQDARDESAKLMTVLTVGKWAKLIGSDPEGEQHVYAFAADGTYVYQVKSPIRHEPINGKWRLEVDKKERVHLILENEKVRRHFLCADSLIRHDPMKDVLFVSGEGYRGEHSLRHIEAK